MATNREFDQFNSDALNRNDAIAAQFKFGMSAEQIAEGMHLRVDVVKRVLAMYGLAYDNDPQN